MSPTWWKLLEKVLLTLYSEHRIIRYLYFCRACTYTALQLLFAGLGRIGVPLLTDGTYQKIQRPSDQELNKLLFCQQYNRHILKAMMICTVHPKVKYLPIQILNNWWQISSNIQHQDRIISNKSDC